MASVPSTPPRSVPPLITIKVSQVGTGQSRDVKVPVGTRAADAAQQAGLNRGMLGTRQLRVNNDPVPNDHPLKEGDILTCPKRGRGGR